MEIDKEDLKRHQKDWHFFINMVIWTTAFVVVTLIGMALFLL